MITEREKKELINSLGITEEDLDNLEQQLIFDPSVDRASLLKEMQDINYAKRELLQREIRVRQQLANPEETKKVIEIVSRKHKTILDNEVTEDNFSIVHKSCTTPEEELLYDKRKNQVIHNLPSVLKDHRDHVMHKEMKKRGLLDMRKQRHKKKPSDYIDSIALAKFAMDTQRRLEELEIKVKNNEERTNARLNRVDDVISELKEKQAQESYNINVNIVLNEELTSKIAFLASSGLSLDKIDLYRMKTNYPALTQKQLASHLGKTDRTVRNWIKAIDDVLLDYEALNVKPDIKLKDPS